MEKLAKGYTETTAPGAAAAPSRARHALQAPLEAALVENPDEVTAHAAYADYLVEEGDPRGAFMQTQLALEEAGRVPAERKQLQKREQELLAAHAREWLGDLGRFLVGDWSGEDKPYHYAFRRGWLDYLRVLPAPLALLGAIARAPEVRLLRRLEVVYDMRYHPFNFDEWVKGPAKGLTADEGEIDFDSFYISDHPADLRPFIASRYLTNLRALKFGFSDDPSNLCHSTMVSPFETLTAQQVLDLLTKCPRLEELYLNNGLAEAHRLFASPMLSQVRVLQYYYGTDGSRFDRNPPRPITYELAGLANNPAIANVNTLRFHPGRHSVLLLPQVDALLQSPHLPKLAHLQLHMTTFGDDICPRLIASGILKRLKTLDLGYGNMTDAGAQQLAACADTKQLQVLDLSRNALTPAGVAALRSAGVRVVADAQHAANEDYPEYLYGVDVE
ncbi:MAG TPA: TIGR02996 domain-containing protein [Gemmata sp.]